MILEPRDYQLEAIKEVVSSWNRGAKRPAVVLPTGAGKTVTFAHLISQWLPSYPGFRVVVLVHRDELAKQAAEKITAVVPDLEVGIVKAEQNDTEADVIVASVQTLFNANRRRQLRGVGMVVVDECHHYAAPAYREVLEELGLFDGSVLGVGFTATMTRSDTYGLGDIWEEIVYEKNILWGIANGFLTDVRAESVTVEGLNLAEVARNRDDYQEGKLGEALINSGASSVVALAYKEKCGDRQGIAFCPTVASAEDLTDALNAYEVPSYLITGETPIETRQRAYENYRNKKIQVLVSVMALTEGFDMPQAQVAVMYRPMRSLGLRIQAAGRVLRPFPGKDEALLLDVVGAIDDGSLTGISALLPTELVPLEGESVAEALERDEQEQGSVESDVLTGRVTYHVRNLFKGSDAVWLQTKGGKWFIPLKRFLIVLMPQEDGKFRVARTHSSRRSRGEDAGWLTPVSMSLEFAMAYAEQLALEKDPVSVNRDRDWRKSKHKATKEQHAMAQRIGLKVDPKIRKGDMSDRLAVHFASKMLD